MRRATAINGCNPDFDGISIHALLAESDGGFVAGSWRLAIFLSTLSLRRATGFGSARLAPCVDFYPRSPCGERRGFVAGSWRLAIFLSTLSLRRATRHLLAYAMSSQISIHALLAESDTIRKRQVIPVIQISIHALLAESDLCLLFRAGVGCLFLSTLSLRRATVTRVARTPTTVISIHALLAESDASQTDLPSRN